MSDIVIAFEPPTLSGGVVVTNQYDSLLGVNGVDFSYGPPALPSDSQIPLSGYGVLVTRPSPPGAPGTQVVALQGAGEFGDAAAFASFNSPHQHVNVLVGGINSGANPSLTAYDINGQVVGTASGSVLEGGPGAQLNIVSPNAAPDIIFIVIQGADNGVILWIKNLSYDPISSPAPDFLLNNVFVSVSPGFSVTQASQLVRLGGSNGPVNLQAGLPLPTGISVTFNPPSVSGTDESFSVIVEAESNAPLGQATFAISGTPASAAVGAQERFAQGTVSVNAPFLLLVQPGYAPQVAIAPCSPGVVSVELVSNPGFNPAPPGLALDINCLGLPANINCTINPAAVQLAAFPSSVLISIAFFTTGHAPGNFPIGIVAGTTYGSVSVTADLTLNVLPTSIESVSPLYASTPQALQEGTTILIKGAGFCPGTKVRFGNDKAIATPNVMTSYEIYVNVPRNATTGVLGPGAKTPVWAETVPFGLILPDGSTLPAPSQFQLTINSYRNVFGFSFKNYYWGGNDFDQLTELFGEDATHISTIFGEVTNLWAVLFLTVTNAFLKLGHDICFGIALGTQRLMNAEWGSVNIQDIPTDDLPEYYAFFYMNATAGPYPLGSPTPPAPLNDFLHVLFMAQVSSEWLNYYLTISLSNSASYVKNYIMSRLEINDFPLVALRSGGTGHVVVAYDIEANPNDPAGFVIDTYDPNEEFTANEDGDSTGAFHDLSLQISKITVGGDGSWSFPFSVDNTDPTPYPPSDYWTGSIDSLVPGSASIIPATPSMPGVFSSLLYAAEEGLVALGSGNVESRKRESSPKGRIETVQLSDASGRTLFGADGKLNQDPNSRVAAVPFVPMSGGASPSDMFIVKQGAAYRYEFRGTVAGTCGVSLVGSLFNVVLQSATLLGQRDEVTFDTGERSFTFKTTATDVPLRAEVMARGRDGSVRIATLVTRGTSGAIETMRFSSDTSAVTYEHRGPPSTYELQISAMNRKGRLHTFASGMQVATEGQTATFTPTDWHDLGRVTFAQGGTTATRIISGQLTSSEHGSARRRTKGTTPKKSEHPSSSRKKGRRGRGSKKEAPTERTTAKKKKSKEKSTNKSNVKRRSR